MGLHLPETAKAPALEMQGRLPRSEGGGGNRHAFHNSALQPYTANRPTRAHLSTALQFPSGALPCSSVSAPLDKPRGISLLPSEVAIALLSPSSSGALIHRTRRPSSHSPRF